MKKPTKDDFQVGVLVGLKCKVDRGASPSEKFVVCEIKGDNPFNITGAIQNTYADEIKKKVIAVVAERPNKETVSLFFNGEIFSPGNPVFVPLSWLKENSDIIQTAA